MTIEEKIIGIMNKKVVQASVFGFFIFANAILFGVADIMQNYGSRYNPPNYWLGFSIKFITGIIWVSCYVIVIKRYKPYHIKTKAEKGIINKVKSSD